MLDVRRRGAVAAAVHPPTSASFAFHDGWPLDVSLQDGAAQIDLRSLELT